MRRKQVSKGKSAADAALDTVDGVATLFPEKVRFAARPTEVDVSRAEAQLGEPFPALYRRILLAFGPLGRVMRGRSNLLYLPSEVVSETQAARELGKGFAKSGDRALMRELVFVQGTDSWSNDRVGLLRDGRAFLQSDRTVEALALGFEERVRRFLVESLAVDLKAALEAPERALHVTIEGDVPETIATLSRVEVLDLWPTRGLPDSIGELQRLRHLVLHGVPLDDVPEAILTLPRLESLEIFSAGPRRTARTSTSTKVLPKSLESLLRGFAKTNASRETRAFQFALLLGRWDRARELATPEALAAAGSSNVAAVRTAAARLASEGAPEPRAGALVEAAAADADVVPKLRELLGSPDVANQQLAIRMLEAGGIPRGMLEELVLLTFESGADWSKRPVAAATRDGVRRLLAKSHPRTLDAIKRVVGRGSLRKAGETKTLRYLEALGPASEGELDTMTLARLIHERWGGGVQFLLTRAPTETIRHLHDGDRLDLSGNELTDLHPSLRELDPLRRLLLRANHFRVLPRLVLELASLEMLDLSATDLRDLPEAFSKLTKLRALGLAGTKMTTVPHAVFELAELRTLDFSTNQYGSRRLTVWPAELAKLTRLRSLRLDGHAFEKWPARRPPLDDLRRLGLMSTRLAQVPRWLADLPALRLLDVRSAECEDGSLPLVVKRLRERHVHVAT